MAADRGRDFISDDKGLERIDRLKLSAGVNATLQASVFGMEQLTRPIEKKKFKKGYLIFIWMFFLLQKRNLQQVNLTAMQ